ncbi:uncharacterized protein V1516DRAFT_662314 [Lipomyces oligophaga]|uniref:uncharacterized protein n=1 Tax=Lipomyces oligophaga TaxID=45792 RepID=UPI0034CD40CA
MDLYRDHGDTKVCFNRLKVPSRFSLGANRLSDNVDLQTLRDPRDPRSSGSAGKHREHRQSHVRDLISNYQIVLLLRKTPIGKEVIVERLRDMKRFIMQIVSKKVITANQVVRVNFEEGVQLIAWLLGPKGRENAARDQILRPIKVFEDANSVYFVYDIYNISSLSIGRDQKKVQEACTAAGVQVDLIRVVKLALPNNVSCRLVVDLIGGKSDEHKDLARCNTQQIAQRLEEKYGLDLSGMPYARVKTTSGVITICEEYFSMELHGMQFTVFSNALERTRICVREQPESIIIEYTLPELPLRLLGHLYRAKRAAAAIRRRTVIVAVNVGQIRGRLFANGEYNEEHIPAHTTCENEILETQSRRALQCSKLASQYQRHQDISIKSKQLS